MKKLPKIAQVDWDDAWSNSLRSYRDEDLRSEVPARLHSVGYLIRNDKNGVCLAMERELDDGISRHVCFIPRGIVRKVTIKR